MAPQLEICDTSLKTRRYPALTTLPGGPAHGSRSFLSPTLIPPTSYHRSQFWPEGL